MKANDKIVKEPPNLNPINEEFSADLLKCTNLKKSISQLQHFFKCVVIAIILFVIFEKISRKYKLFGVENYEEDSTELSVPKQVEKENLTFFCDQKDDIQNDNIEAVMLLRDDILNLKQLVIKLGEQVRERRRFECLTRKELSKIEDRVRKVLAESDTVDKKIKKAIHTYEADKVALFDYAASYAGGQVISVTDCIPARTNKISKILGFFKLAKESSPEQILNPSCLPGECFTFLGQTAKIIIKLGKPINIGSVSLEHSFLVEDISSAPKNFIVYGLQDSTGLSGILLNNCTYEISNKRCLQTFEIEPTKTSTKKYEYVMLELLNNHGHKKHTSIYRFRVHSR